MKKPKKRCINCQNLFTPENSRIKNCKDCRKPKITEAERWLKGKKPHPNLTINSKVFFGRT